MNTFRKLLAALLVLIMVLSLCACGGNSGQSDDSGSNQNGSQSGDNNETGTPKDDTWENALGQSGTMAYEYKNDRLVKAIFKYGGSDKVWRTIEYGSFEDNAVGIRYYETHCNSNGEKIFSLDIQYFADEGSKDVPQYVSGYDYLFEDTSCRYTMQSDGMAIETLRKNTHQGAEDYWITQYNSKGLPVKTMVYGREGLLLNGWEFYHEKGRVAYGIEYEDYRIYYTPTGLLSKSVFGTTFKFEYDDNGNLIKLVEGYGSPNDKGTIANFKPKDQRNPENSVGVTFEYNAQGQLTKRTSNNTVFTTSQEFTYGSDGKVTDCVYSYGRISNDHRDLGFYELNADGTLATADFGYLNGSHGGGDFSYYVYTYYDNGMFKNVKAYWESARYDDSETLDLEWEKNYNESGALIED